MLDRHLMHRYQNEGVDFILETPKCALWLDMGLGKTVTSLTAAKDLIFAVEAYHVLVIAPLRVAKSTWPNEIAKWGHTKDLTVAVACGTPKQRISATNALADITTINTENVAWLVDLWGQKWPYDFVIIDESSAFKAHDTKRFKALKRVSNKIDRMVQLTGTPAPNGLHQIWPQMFLLDNGARLMKTLTGFRAKYCSAIHMGQHIKWSIRPDAVPLIYKAVEDITLSMKARDYIDMPDVIEVFHDLELSKPEFKTYNELQRDSYLDVSGDEITAVSAAALSAKLCQYASGAVYNDNGGYTVFHDAKINALKEMVAEANGQPLLVAYYFKSDLERIQAAFPDARILDKDPKTIDQWNSREIEILLAHPASAGHGLNLQSGGNIIVWFSQTWNLELYLQFNARLARQGQSAKTVLIHHLNVLNTIDDDISAAIKVKNMTQDALFAALKRRL